MLLDQHSDSMKNDTEARKQRYAFFDQKCGGMEKNLNAITDKAKRRATKSNLDPRIAEIMKGTP